MPEAGRTSIRSSSLGGRVGRSPSLLTALRALPTTRLRRSRHAQLRHELLLERTPDSPTPAVRKKWLAATIRSPTSHPLPDE